LLFNFIHSTRTSTLIQSFFLVLSVQRVIQQSKPAKTNFQTVRTSVNIMWCYQYLVIILTNRLHLACLTRLISFWIKFSPSSYWPLVYDFNYILKCILHLYTDMHADWVSVLFCMFWHSIQSLINVCTSLQHSLKWEFNYTFIKQIETWPVIVWVCCSFSIHSAVWL
jgi:hypothetical protein